MTSATHTPGPWSRNIPPASQYPVIFSGDNVHVAQVISRYCPVDQVEANTNLIAAAPELLDLAKYFLSHARSDLPWTYPVGSLQRLEQVIAKATGATT